jgi:carbon monoxide dehydrogenase subunit G
MTVRVERTVELPVEPERVWEFISDPEKRASAISVVEGYELHGDGQATWHVTIPLPLVNRTAEVRTRETERDPPHSVTFVGESSMLTVEGQHVVEATETGSRLVNRFTVDGKLPGVETFFQKNLDDELENLGAALRAEVGEKL